MTVLVVGAVRGIGNEVAKRLVSLGHDVIGVGRHIQNSDNNDTFEYIQTDIVDKEKLENLFNDIKSRNIVISGIVNCAGAYWPSPAYGEIFPQVEQMMNVNVMGPYNVISKFLALVDLVQRGHGSQFALHVRHHHARRAFAEQRVAGEAGLFLEDGRHLDVPRRGLLLHRHRGDGLLERGIGREAIEVDVPAPFEEGEDIDDLVVGIDEAQAKGQVAGRPPAKTDIEDRKRRGGVQIHGERHGAGGPRQVQPSSAATPWRTRATVACGGPAHALRARRGSSCRRIRRRSRLPYGSRSAEWATGAARC